MRWAGLVKENKQCNFWSNNRTNAVLSIRSQTPEDPVDIDNQIRRLNFSLKNNLKEEHTNYAMEYIYINTRIFSPAVNCDGFESFEIKTDSKGNERLERCI